MSQKDLANPFLSSRSTVSESPSLLSYGDDRYSVYKILKGNSRLHRSQVGRSEKDIEEDILWRYQKQYYEMDQFGNSIAQEAFQKKITEEDPKKDDFWSKLQPLATQKYSSSSSAKWFKDELQTASNFTASTFRKQPASRYGAETVRLDRKANRQEALKLKQRIQVKKQFETAVHPEEQKFSVLKMYKNKLSDDAFGTGTAVTFGHLDSKHMFKRSSELNFKGPQSIYVKDTQYFFVPLS